MIRILIVLSLILLSGIATAETYQFNENGVQTEFTPEVQILFAPPAEVPPYDDEAFFSSSNTSVYQICNGKELPAGSKNNKIRDDLDDTYVKLVQMKISEEKYPDAENITTFLSYTLTNMDSYNDYEKDYIKDSPVIDGSAEYSKAEEYYQAASDVWKNISSLYPDAKMYLMPQKMK